MSESAVDRNMKLENAIVQKALELETLQKRQNILESENAEKAAKLEQLKDNLTVTERNLEELSDRSTAMRDKLRNLDKNVQVEADKISVETKAFFKKLGLKVSQQLLPDENQVELKIQFRECLEFDATIIYDSETEDYDLVSMTPEHANFLQLRDQLRESKDIQGFLAYYRKKILSSIMYSGKASGENIQ